MKKLNQLLLLAVFLFAWSISVGAQERTVELVKNGQVVFSLPASEIEYMTVVNRLPVPKNVRGAADNGTITITWDAVTNATSYKIFRSTDGNAFSLVGTSSTNSFTDNSPLAGSNYYQVQALGANDAQSRMSAVSQPIVSVDENASDYNGHEYVDLGLPSGLKWATCNIGASSPSDYGYYYAWGETTPKGTYTENNSTTYDKSMGDISGNSEYDAARANWGGSWRLPSKKECEELDSKCTWTRTWTSQGGHYGYKVTGPNGNSIFLPAAGYRFGSSLNDAGGYGGYWSSTPLESNAQNAYYLYFSSSYHGVDWNDRLNGFSVRPVSD